jgi:hypothetical protein
MEENIQSQQSYNDILAIAEYTEVTTVNEVLRGSPKLKPVFAVLKGYYKDYRTIIDMINDFRRILEYYNKNHTVCIDFIEEKYPCVSPEYLSFCEHGRLNKYPEGDQEWQEWKDRDAKWTYDMYFIECVKSLIENNIIEADSDFSLLFQAKNFILDGVLSECFANKLNKIYEQAAPKGNNQNTLDKTTEEKVLENFNFWNDLETNKEGDRNIFKDITKYEFLEMVHTADFSKISKKGITTQRVQYNVSVLSRLLGKEWGETAAKNIGTTLEVCKKRTDFAMYKQYDTLKSMYLQ